MNKGGFAIIISFMLGVTLFWLGMVLAPALKPVIADSLTQADCSSEGLTYQQQSTCTVLDAFLPLFLGLILGIGGILLGNAL